MKVLRVLGALLRYRPWLFALSALAWTVIHGLPIIFGILIGQVFDALAGEAPAGASPWTPVAIFAGLALGRIGLVWVGDVAWVTYWNDQGLQLRRNLLRWLLEAPGSRVLPSASGQAVSTFRDDVDDLLEYVENWVDLGGLVVYVIGSVAVMASIDAQLTLFVMVPLVITWVLTQTLAPQIRRRRRAMRIATEEVTGFIGETFGSVQAVKLAGAEEPLLDRFEGLNATRRHMALRDTLLTEILRSVNANMATVGSALVLLGAAAQLSQGTFTVGDLALFLTYLPRLANYMAFAGDIVAQHRRAGVAYERIEKLAVDAPRDALLDRTRVPLTGDLPDLPPVELAAGQRLRLLEATGLTYHYPDSAAGIDGIDLHVERGRFTVITGKIGSGKTTLLRALLGLLPAEGSIEWNGEPVADPASFSDPSALCIYPPGPPAVLGVAGRQHRPRAAGHQRTAARGGIAGGPRPRHGSARGRAGHNGRGAWGEAVGWAGAALRGGPDVRHRCRAPRLRRPVGGAGRGYRGGAVGPSLPTRRRHLPRRFPPARSVEPRRPDPAAGRGSVGRSGPPGRVAGPVLVDERTVDRGAARRLTLNRCSGCAS